nr:unnamed protein product [Spirometra erinaceieuropaei]
MKLAAVADRTIQLLHLRPTRPHRQVRVFLHKERTELQIAWTNHSFAARWLRILTEDVRKAADRDLPTVIRTTDDNPANNHMLKTVMHVPEDTANWKYHLHQALPGKLKLDVNCSAVQFVPGKMIVPTSRGVEEDPTNYAHLLE